MNEAKQGVAEMARIEPSTRPFSEALMDLLRDRDEFTTLMGTPNLSAFSKQLDATHYESLRKIMTGERRLTVEVMEEVARALGIAPDYFSEYRLARFRERFDPAIVGHEQALRNLEEWARSRPKKP